MRTKCDAFKRTLCLSIALLTAMVPSFSSGQNIANDSGSPVPRSLIIFGTQGAAIERLEPECNSGDSGACAQLGSWYTEEPNDNDPNSVPNIPAAVRAYRQGCDLGNGASCQSLANLSQRDPIISPYNPEELHAKACELGVASGCASLAELLVVESTETSRVFFERACELSDLHCAKLANFLHEIVGPESSQVPLHDKACQVHIFESYAVLALWYSEGIAVPPDFFRAFDYAEAACVAIGNSLVLGDARACSLAGQLLERGVGVRQDLHAAMERYGRACDLRDQDGCDDFARLNAQLRRVD